jgi:ribonucleoside-diphosphate reductase beta chain
MKQANERKLYDTNAPNKSTKILNGESSNILNWDDVRFKWAAPKYKNMLGNFWVPTEVNMGPDVKQWADALSADEKETFLKIIGLLAFLDSIQSDYAAKVADYITDSSVNALLIILAQQEVIHNHSYSYILSSLVSKQKQDEVFEYWKKDAVLLERNKFIADGYEEFIHNKTPETVLKSIVYDVILEGLFFYAGFAFFYNLARNNKMVATSTMINYINRDENVHVDLFVNIYKEILNDFPHLNTPEFQQWVTAKLKEAALLEIKWGQHVIGQKFDGIDMDEMAEYIKFMANKRAIQMGAERPFSRDNRNPMPWIKYFENADDGKTDFFEQKSRQYVKVSEDNGFDDL